jgi:tRNA-specific 2-thiouridylase
MKAKVYVGISGGVDSAVAAAILLEQGYDVTGVFMKNWSGEDYGIADECPWEADLRDSIEVCEHLGIPHKTFNFEKEYRDLVIEEFFREYQLGNTPNPDVLCNKFIKFDIFLMRCLEEGADLIATGHYAQVKSGNLYKAVDTNKDQTYFLSRVKKSQLEKVLFPLGQLTKPEIRELAKKYNLPNAEKKDSQGICFVGKVNMGEFLRTRINEMEGDFIDIDTGKVVGRHKGIYFYTNGQRKGIQIGGLSEPYFVASKDIDKNIVYLAKGKENPHLWKKEILVKDLDLINPELDLSNAKEAMIRYRSNVSGIRVEEFEEGYKLSFKDSQWAPAPGQTVVFFDDDKCLGAAIISEIP